MTADDTATVRDPRFRHLFDDVPDAVVEFEFVDGEPVVRAVNDAFVDLFGYDREETLGEPLNEFIVPRQLRDQSARFDERTAAGKTNDAPPARTLASDAVWFIPRESSPSGVSAFSLRSGRSCRRSCLARTESGSTPAVVAKYR